jgi:hypothetical protein
MLSSCLGAEYFTLTAEISATRLHGQNISIARHTAYAYYYVAKVVDRQGRECRYWRARRFKDLNEDGAVTESFTSLEV